MKRALFLILAATVLYAQPAAPGDESSGDQEQASDLNVNSRYTVESIGFLGRHHYRLSTSALNEMQRLVGTKLNTDALNGLIRRIRSELSAHTVTFKLARGGDPESVRVLIDVDRGAGNLDLSFPRFAYNSREGWSATGEVSATVGDNKVTLDLLSDGDSLVERYGGVQVRIDRLSLLDNRLKLSFEFDGYSTHYNDATAAALGAEPRLLPSSLGAGSYGSRLNFEPSATFVLARPLTWTVGLSFEQLHSDLPAARSVAANAVINSLRYRQRWQASDATKQELDAGYSLRAATKVLGTDFSYTRHSVNARYALSHDHQSLEVALVAGVIYGQAPLFERFVLGNDSTLRGWNKYDLDPIGGNRMVHGSVTYGYHIMRVFYDTGAIWESGQSPDQKHSAGVGISGGLGLFQRGAFLLAVAFPLRQGRADPVFIAGMNF